MISGHRGCRDVSIRKVALSFLLWLLKENPRMHPECLHNVKKSHVLIEFSIKRQCSLHNDDFQHGLASGKPCLVVPQGLEFALIQTED